MININGQIFGGRSVNIGGSISSSGDVTIVNGRVVSGGVNGDATIGSGPKVRQEREVAEAFDSIVLGGSIDVQVDANEAQSRVAVEAQENLQSHIETRIADRTLYIESKGSFSTDQNPTVIVDMGSLEKITLRGSGDALITDLEGENFSALLQGSGDIRAKGQIKNLDVAIQGSGDFRATGLIADQARVNIMGSGDASLGPSSELNASVMGSGDVRYSGSPKVLRSVMGSGSVEAF